ncbi:unnamed protein product [Linum trigynum]|uniref:Uncharacterized protein n=1 Tax=Linum trigynum TaxID=586398 RepID=A0AAV2FXU9_9ROSI
MSLLLAQPPPFSTPLPPSLLSLWRTQNPIRRLPLPLDSRSGAMQNPSCDGSLPLEVRFGKMLSPYRSGSESVSIPYLESPLATSSSPRFQVWRDANSLAWWLSSARGQIHHHAVSLERRFSIPLNSIFGAGARTQWCTHAARKLDSSFIFHFSNLS